MDGGGRDPVEGDLLILNEEGGRDPDDGDFLILKSSSPELPFTGLLLLFSATLSEVMLLTRGMSFGSLSDIEVAACDIFAMLSARPGGKLVGGR